MKFRHSILSFTIGFFGLQAMGQELVRPVITGAPFLQIVPDARAGGMGEVGVSSLPDSYSQFHNPAKFLFFKNETSGIGLSYVPQFSGFSNDIFLANAAYFQQLNDRSAVGASLTYFSFGNIEDEKEMGGEIINQGSFVPNEMALDVSYSLKLSDNYGMSISGRYIRSDITNNQSNVGIELRAGNAVAVDISGYYVSSIANEKENMWTLGFNLKNLGSKLSYSDEEDFSYPLPAYLKLGGGYHFMSGKNDILSFYGEAMKYLVLSTNDQGKIPTASAAAGWFRSFADAPDGFSEELKEVTFSLGSEYNFNEVLKLRTGYITQSREKGFRNHMTFGLGLVYNRFNFDFAYQTPLNNDTSFDQNDLFKLSLSLNFIGREKPQKELDPTDEKEIDSLQE